MQTEGGLGGDPSIASSASTVASVPSRTPPRPAGWPLAGGQTLGDRGDATTRQARSGAAYAATMEGFPGGNPDPQQLEATMLAIKQACSLIKLAGTMSLIHDGVDAEKQIVQMLKLSMGPCIEVVAWVGSSGTTHSGRGGNKRQ